MSTRHYTVRVVVEQRYVLASNAAHAERRALEILARSGFTPVEVVDVKKIDQPARGGVGS